MKNKKNGTTLFLLLLVVLFIMEITFTSCVKDNVKNISKVQRSEKMISDFFKENIAPLLISNNKPFDVHSYELSCLYLLIEKKKRGENGDIALYKSILGDELFNYEITDEEEDLILNCFKMNIKNKTKHAIHCMGDLERALCHDSFRFIFDQLKENINGNTYFVAALLKNCSFFIDDEQEKELLKFLKEQLKNNSLEKRLKKYMQDLIDFQEHRISGLSSPSIYWDSDGNNLTIEWWDDVDIE